MKPLGATASQSPLLASLPSKPSNPPTNTEQCPADPETKDRDDMEIEKDRGVLPLTAPASVARGTVVTGGLAIRLHITRLGEPAATEGQTT